MDHVFIHYSEFSLNCVKINVNIECYLLLRNVLIANAFEQLYMYYCVFARVCLSAEFNLIKWSGVGTSK